MKPPKIPDIVIRRVPLYLRVVSDLEENDTQIVSSQELGKLTSLTPAQVRKDLAFFGGFGKQGIGYDVSFLRLRLCEILGLDTEVRIALIGVGHLGLALARYNMGNMNDPNRHSQANPRVAALFDVDPDKIGMLINNVPVRHIDDLASTCCRKGITMAILTVPAGDAQKVADMIKDTPVRAVLNFSPVKLRLPNHIKVRNSDLALELQSLAYYASKSTPLESDCVQED